jgi:hypothetical protein
VYSIALYNIYAKIFMPFFMNGNLSTREATIRNADKIRNHGREQYVLPARNCGDRRFSIPVRDVVHALGLSGRAPAVCSALKTGKFLKDNHLRVVETIAPKSGQSTTVVYTYEFVDMNPSPAGEEDAWVRLHGALKDIFGELGGGEAYLRRERSSFYPSEEGR